MISQSSWREHGLANRFQQVRAAFSAARCTLHDGFVGVIRVRLVSSLFAADADVQEDPSLIKLETMGKAGGQNSFDKQFALQLKVVDREEREREHTKFNLLRTIISALG